MDLVNIEIVLIEDNPHEAELTIRSLKKHNLANRLVHIDDGQDAMEFLFSTGKYENNIGMLNPKIILLDLKLPKVNGLEILKKIREDERTKHFPVVVLTSSKEESDVFESYKLGVNSYIVKPVNFESFTNAVTEIGLYWMLLNEPPAF
ncbi:MAG: response regulator [Bacteroidetes bacterium]|nr:response regulator [Bacteroidota bacterium]